MSYNITVEGGTSVRLLTSGKYCEEDIVIKTTGGGTTPANPIIEPLSVTENGTYTAPSGVDGYSPIEVNVPIPDGYIVPSGTKTITENGTHDAREYESVAVNVPIPEGYIKPSGTLNIDKNGTYDVAEKASAVVSIPKREIVLQDKTIEANGTYTADSGYDGLGQVTVNVQGGGSEELDKLLEGSITEINSNATSIIQYGCYARESLKTVNLPECTSLDTRCFQDNYDLVTFNAPKLKTLGTFAFYRCSELSYIYLPFVKTAASYAFYACSGLKKADLPVASSITAYAFYGCSTLEALILRKSDAICILSNANAISSSGVDKGTGYVYVPKALLSDEDETKDYRRATNWSTFANQFRAIEDYPEICGG